MNVLGTEEPLRDLCERNAPAFDEDAFVDRLSRRAGKTRMQPRAVRGRRRVRIAIFASVAVILAAAAAVGGLEAARHLGGHQSVLLIGEDTSGALSTQQDASAGYRSLGFQVTRSLSKLSLADLWQELATHLGVDPATARVRGVHLEWDENGLLDQLMLEMSSPDGMEISVSGFFIPTEHSDTDPQYLDIRSGTGPGSPGIMSRRDFSSSAVFVGAETLLAALDHFGLPELTTLASQQTTPSGQSAGSNAIDLTWSALPTVIPETSDNVFTTPEEAAGLGAQGLAVFVGAAGKVTRLDPAQLASVRLPALCLEVSGVRKATDSAGNVSSTGGQIAYALVSLPVEAAGAATEAVPVDDRLDALAFTTPAMDVCRVHGGTVATLWAAGEDIMTTLRHPSASYGVSYSLGRSLVVRGTDYLAPSAQESDNSGTQSSAAEARVVVGIPVDDPGASSELLRIPYQNQELSPLSVRDVVFDETKDRLWVSGFSLVSNENGTNQVVSLQTAQPHTSGLSPIALGHPFDGEFAVSPDGSTILYIGYEGDRPRVTLRTGDKERELSLGLARAYHPVFSPDGGSVCVVGSKEADQATSLWLYDLKGGKLRQIRSTEGLTPTYPAFSPDGTRVAFRHFELGDIWTVSIADGALTRYALLTEDAPIAW